MARGGMGGNGGRELRVQLWACGGGRQSAGIAALILERQLPRPDHVVMVALEREVGTVWPYVNRYVRPALEAIGVPFTVIRRRDYAAVDLWSGAAGDSLVLPAFSMQTGSVAKLPEYCSGEWKREVVIRWAAEQSDWKARGVDSWVGISWDERSRRRSPRRRWFRPAYPLLDVRPTTVSGCLAAVERIGWPEPPRSRCSFCPNQSDREWLELAPAEFEAACRTDEEIRAIDSTAFLHRACIPLRLVAFEGAKRGDLFSGGCSSGMCF